MRFEDSLGPIASLSLGLTQLLAACCSGRLWLIRSGVRSIQCYLSGDLGIDGRRTVYGSVPTGAVSPRARRSAASRSRMV